MVINALKTFVLASNILLLDYYFITENIRIPLLSIFLLIIFYVIDVCILRREPIFVFAKHTDKIIKVAFIFIGYIVLIDFYRNASIYNAVIFATTTIMLVALLPIFEDRRIQYNLIPYFKFFVIVSAIFAMVQFITANENIILCNYLSDLGIFKSNRLVDAELFSDNYFRTSGASSYIIPFAIQISLFIIIEYVTFMQFRRPKEIISILASFFILLTTQIRAAVFSIVPIMIATQAFFGRLHKHYQKMASIVFWVVIASLAYLSLGFILTKMTYIGRSIMEHDTHRFVTNWIMTIGVLKESPLFGISPERAWDIYLQYGGERNYYLYTHHTQTVPTHHNQLGFYLRYYGLIGVFLLCWLYVLIFKKIMRAKSFWIGVALR